MYLDMHLDMHLEVHEFLLNFAPKRKQNVTMSNVLFELRIRSKKMQTAQIHLSYYFDRSTKFSYPLGYKVYPDDWDKKKHRVKNVIREERRDEINAKLSDIETKVNAWLTDEALAKREPTRESLRTFLDKLTKPKAAYHTAVGASTTKSEKSDTGLKAKASTIRETDSEVHEFFDKFVNNAENRTSQRTGLKVGRETLLSYQRCYKYLIEFEEEQCRILTWQDFGLLFYQEYTAFLQKKGLSVNSVGREIKTLKVFLNSAYWQGADLNKEYFKKGIFRVVREEADNIYLTKDELRRLYLLDLTDKPTLERVRDVFLVGCYTGLRYSDYSRLTLKDVHGNLMKKYDGLIKMYQKKTGAEVIIPLHPVVTAILQKYGGRMPLSPKTGKPMTSQKFNKYLREVCKQPLNGEPCISGKETKRTTKGGVTAYESMNRYDMVSSHTARRTFATLNYLDGVPAEYLMKITGHATESAFKKYIKVGKEEAANLMMDNWRRNGEFVQLAK